MKRRDPGANLGRTQVLVLRLLALAHRPKTVRDLAYDWPGLTESSVRSALDRLGMRGLVDMAGFDQGARPARTYELTAKGSEVEAALLDDEDERESFDVTDPVVDAPDGAVMFDEDDMHGGGWWQRRGDRWYPTVEPVEDGGRQ